jgi:elongation factor P hydroxylase
MNETNEPVTVYQVIFRDYDAYQVLETFATEELTEQHVAQMEKLYTQAQKEAEKNNAYFQPHVGLYHPASVSIETYEVSTSLEALNLVPVYYWYEKKARSHERQGSLELCSPERAKLLEEGVNKDTRTAQSFKGFDDAKKMLEKDVEISS